jgi:hypothetical protein
MIQDRMRVAYHQTTRLAKAKNFRPAVDIKRLDIPGQKQIPQILSHPAVVCS